MLVKLQLGNAGVEALASHYSQSWSFFDQGSQTPAWEPAQNQLTLAAGTRLLPLP